MFRGWKKRRIYLDYAAATPVRREALKVMANYFEQDFGNPGSIHKEGLVAKQAVEEAREKMARTLRVRANDIIFTSGGTESNNLALRGPVRAMREAGVVPGDIEIISTAVEHPSILKTLEALKKEGYIITFAPIDEEGLVIESEFKKLLSSKTRLVSIAYANSETGVVQEIGRLSRIARGFEKVNGLTVLFHVDASQAPVWLPCALDAIGADMMTLDAGKCEGPKGVGALIVRPRAKLAAISFGGSQERSLRPGTEPVPLIMGFAVALELAQKEQPIRAKQAKNLRDRFISELINLPRVVLNGSQEHRLSNNVNISLPGLDTEFTVVVLDKAGIACGTKSACSGAGSGRSNVVYEMSKDDSRSRSTIRFTFGPDVTWSDLKKTAYILKKHIGVSLAFQTSLDNK